MKKTIFLSLAMAAMTITGFAQGAAAAAPKGGQNLSADDRAKQQADKINGVVQLSKDQYAKVVEVIKNDIAQRDALRASGASGEDAKAKMRSYREDRDTKLKAILTADQWKKMEDMKKQQMQQRKGGQ